MFEPGYTPRGWRRGCTIDVALPPRVHGVRTYGEMRRVQTTRIDVITPMETHTVKFTSDDIVQLHSWLMWWYANDVRAQAQVRAKFQGWV